MRSAAPVIGLVPTSPVTAEVGTSVMPDFVRITKSPADRRFTGAGPGPAANALPATARSAIPVKYLFFIMCRRVGVCLRHALGNVAQLASNCDQRGARALSAHGPGSANKVPFIQTFRIPGLRIETGRLVVDARNVSRPSISS